MELNYIIELADINYFNSIKDKLYPNNTITYYFPEYMIKDHIYDECELILKNGSNVCNNIHICDIKLKQQQEIIIDTKNKDLYIHINKISTYKKDSVVSKFYLLTIRSNNDSNLNKIPNVLKSIEKLEGIKKLKSFNLNNINIIHL